MLINLLLESQLHRLADQLSASEQDGDFDVVEHGSVGGVVGNILNVPEIGLGLFEKEGFCFAGGVEFGRNVLALGATFHGDLLKNECQEIATLTQIAQSRNRALKHPIWIEKETPEKRYVVVEIKPRKNSTGICPECGKTCPTYDTAQEHRWWEFVALWAIPVYFVYKMRRVTCPDHGEITERDRQDLHERFEHP